MRLSKIISILASANQRQHTTKQKRNNTAKEIAMLHKREKQQCKRERVLPCNAKKTAAMQCKRDFWNATRRALMEKERLLQH